MIFGEFSNGKPFDHEHYFGEIKRRLEPAVSLFHYDGTYWKENDKEKTTGFYQTVRLKPGIYRNYLYNLENWPRGTTLVELRRKEENYLKPW